MFKRLFNAVFFHKLIDYTNSQWHGSGSRVSAALNQSRARPKPGSTHRVAGQQAAEALAATYFSHWTGSSVHFKHSYVTTKMRNTSNLFYHFKQCSAAEYAHCKSLQTLSVAKVPVQLQQPIIQADYTSAVPKHGGIRETSLKQ